MRQRRPIPSSREWKRALGHHHGIPLAPAKRPALRLAKIVGEAAEYKPTYQTRDPPHVDLDNYPFRSEVPDKLID